MTSIAIAAGMVPSAMAVAVIGGLIVSTGLSLVFVPAIFLLVDDLSRLFVRLFGRCVGGTDEPEGEDAGAYHLGSPANAAGPYGRAAAE